MAKLFTQRQWWILAVGTTGVGDLMTTALIPRYRQVGGREANPRLDWINDPETTSADVLRSFGLLKLVWFSAWYLVYRTGTHFKTTRGATEWLPVAFTIIGAAVTGHNAIQMYASEQQLKEAREYDAWAERVTQPKGNP